jgi:hypothetical protein
VSSFASSLISHRFSGNVTGTDHDRTEVDSWLLASSCYMNSAVLLVGPAMQRLLTVAPIVPRTLDVPGDRHFTHSRECATTKCQFLVSKRRHWK